MQFKDIIGHKQTISALIDTVEKNRISHALIFYGQEGIGKISLAIAYAQYLNCTNKQNGDSCGECKSCKKFANIAHPDLHFVFPVVKTPSISNPVSLDFINQWREFVLKSKFHGYNEWLQFIGSDNLQGSIYAQESQEIIRIINLKTFEAQYKVVIIYLPEKMNITAANKLLKAIEEPPPYTLFILITEDEASLLTTIRSRTQLIKINNLSVDELKEALKEEFNDTDDVTLNDIIKISAGNYIYARQTLQQETNSGENILSENFNLFTDMMRNSYSLNIQEITNTVEEISKLGRERQKSFIEYSIRFLRENFILNISDDKNLNYLTKKEAEFSSKFKQFIHKKNIDKLFEEFNNAFFDITRNAAPKILFLDLCLKLAKLLKVKPD